MTNYSVQIVCDKDDVKYDDTAKVDYNGRKSYVYRGENSLEVRKGIDVKVDENGYVGNDRGVSVNVDSTGLDKYDGAYEVKSIPDELKIIQRGSNAKHFEIAPKESMPLEHYKDLLKQVVLERIN